MFLDGPKGPERTEPAWENVTTISEAVGKGQVQPVSMCDKCPPAVRSMLAGKEETAAAEKSARLSCSWPRLLPMPGGCRQGLCSRPYTGKLGTWVC